MTEGHPGVGFALNFPYDGSETVYSPGAALSLTLRGSFVGSEGSWAVRHGVVRLRVPQGI